MDREAIEAVLPHRPPMLLVDSVIELEPGQRAVGLREVTEEDCAGHFPGEPIFPGVKIAEALAQVAAVCFLVQEEAHQGRPVYLVGLDRFRFRRPVRPGEVLRLEVRVTQARRALIRLSALATVDGARVADGEILATAPDPGTS